MTKKILMIVSGLAVIAGLMTSASAQSDITQPGDTIVASSDNSPGSEGVANAIDGQPTKYLNFDITDTGFTVTPSIGLTIVSGLTLQSANDAPERDPASYRLEGSNDGTTFTLISEGDVPAFTERFETVSISFENSAVYGQYRLTFPTVANGDAANSMQIAEVELIGVQGPTDVTQPGDAITASSDNSPGSEGVANAIDNQPTKYLNFDIVNTGFTVTPGVGGTIVTGLGLQSANDAPERDPATYLLEGSLDGETFFTISEGDVPAFAARFDTRYVFFENSRAFATYRLTFPTVANGDAANSMQIAEVELLGSVADLPQDVTQPGDAVTASSDNSPGSEGVANAIDNQPTKYLNFDILNTGLTVTPSTGLTIVSGLTLQSANDAPERDPASFLLEGSNDGETFATIAEGEVGAFADRFTTQTFLFDNAVPYSTYRLTFPTVANGDAANSMQIAEVELLGVSGPQDVTQPGDAIIASSDNSPGSEGVANAIDNQPTKYLNFDIVDTGFTVTPQVGETIVTGLTLQSANDAPERDPATYRLEGSNNGTDFSLISEGDVPAFTERFQTKYVFFVENTMAYTTYRLTFPTVANGDAANSMQIAEVELLGVVPGGGPKTEVTSGLIRRQPTDAVALEGFGAQLRLIATGPWKVQWFVQDAETGEFSAIPGATNPDYTTPALTPETSGAVYRAEVSSPREVQISNVVTATLFTPSENRSIGLNFVGSGANGAPTEMLPEDITGFHMQAYWNNLTGSTGDLFSSIVDPDPDDDVTPVAVDSNNEEITDITFDFAAASTWGSGTGEADATQRMLNGILETDTSTRPVAPTFRFFGVPEGDHSLLLYMVQRPLEFFGLNIEVVTLDDSGVETVHARRFARPQNSDEYNPAPGYVLITAETAEARSVGNMVRIDNINPGEFQEIQVYIWQPGTTGNPGVNGAQLVLNTGEVPVPPTIVTQPVSLNGYVGGGRQLTVEVAGEGAEIQWFKNGQAIPGATSATLDLGRLTADSAGAYTAAVSNEGGRIVSRAAIVDVLDENDLQTGLTTHITFDSSNSDPDLDLMNAAGITNGGLIGGALELDGIDAYAFLPSYEQPEAAMTFSIWAQTDVDTNLQWGPIANSWIASRATGSEGQFRFSIFENFDANGDVFMEQNAAIGVGPNVPTAIGQVMDIDDLTAWHHYAFTANGNQLTVYFDGQPRGVIDYLGDINMSAFGWLAIGANLVEAEVDGPLDIDFNAFPAVWQGMMDDLAIWSRSLGADEILAIYEAGLEGTSADAVESPLPESTVVETSISIGTEEGSLIINFEGGALYSTPALGTEFQPVDGASSPYTVPTTEEAEFFIVK